MTIEVTGKEIQDTFYIEWRDHGIGVPDEDLPKLFTSFYRTDKARSQVADVSGLGLAIVKEIVETMEGTVRAAATPGGGLTITIALPVTAPSSATKENKGGNA